MLPKSSTLPDADEDQPDLVQKNDYNMASIDLEELKEHIKALDPHYKTLTIVL